MKDLIYWWVRKLCQYPLAEQLITFGNWDFGFRNNHLWHHITLKGLLKQAKTHRSIFCLGGAISACSTLDRQLFTVGNQTTNQPRFEMNLKEKKMYSSPLFLLWKTNISPAAAPEQLFIYNSVVCATQLFTNNFLSTTLTTVQCAT